MNNTTDSKIYSQPPSSDEVETIRDDIKRVTEEAQTTEKTGPMNQNTESEPAHNSLGLDDIHIPDELIAESTSPGEHAISRGYVIGGIVALIALVCVFAYVASSVLSKLSPHAAQPMSTNSSADVHSTKALSSNDLTNTISNGLIAKLPNAETATEKTVPLNIAESNHSSNLAEENNDSDNDVVTKSREDYNSIQKGEALDADPIVQRDNQDVMVSTAGEDVSLTPSAISAEDQLYDKLLNVMPKEGIPTEAIKIDQNVIKRQVATGQISVLEKGLITTKEEVSGLNTQVHAVQTTLSDLTKRFDSSISNQSQSISRIEEIAKNMVVTNKAQDAEIKDLKASLAAAIKTAERLESQIESRSKGIQKVSPEQKVIVAPEKIKSQVSSLPVKSVVVPPANKVVVAANEPKQSTPTCGTASVSAIWRVKGVNSTSAYVVRTEDSFGLFVREGSEIPGYGVVKSFDTATRSVCTSTGMVKR